MKKLNGLILFSNLLGKSYTKKLNSKIQEFKSFKPKSKLKRNVFLLIMVVIFAGFGGLTFSRQSEAVIAAEETAEVFPLTALTPTPTPPPCIQPIAMPSPPPVLFRVSGKAIISRFNGGDVVQECSDFQDGQNIASPRGSFSLTNPDGGRSATMSWTADIGQLTGTFESVTNQFITRETDNNSKTENQVEIYVRGNFGTPYFLQFNSNGTASIQSSSNAPMLRYSAGIYDGFTNVAVGKPDLSATLPLQNSYTSPPNSTASGACITVPEYPGVTYCRVYSNLNPYPIGSAIDANYSPITGGFNLNARGQLTVSYRAHINIGVPPTAIIEGPICEDEERTTVPVGLSLTFNSLSYDSDNNQGTQVGVGILKYDWKIRKPNGSEIPYENHSPTLNYTPDVEGNYVATLKVTDDEGMTSTITKNFQVVECKVTSVEFEELESPLDENPSFSIPGGGNSGTGKRIFADKETYVDTRNYKRIRVKATTNCPCLMPTVYFQSFDVDDPSSNEYPLDTNGAVLGGDNRDSIYPRGQFIGASAGSLNKISAMADSNGIATVSFEVGRNPGDNYRIGAAINENYLNEINEGTNAELNSDSSIEVNGRVPVSDKLYVWRRLHIEVDSMGEIPSTGDEKNHVEGTISGEVSFREKTNVNVNANEGERQITILLLSIHPNSIFQDKEKNRFQNGRIFITGLGSFNVLENEDGNSTPLILNIKINGKVSGSLNRQFKLYDDDNLSGNSILNGDEGFNIPMPDYSTFVASSDSPENNVFASAYIKPSYDLYAFQDDNVLFNLNVESFELESQITISRQSLTFETDDFWIAYIQGTYQSRVNEDGDPNERNIVAGSAVFIGILGRDDIPNTAPKGAVGAFAFLEGTRDLGTFSQGRVVAHEIGHQFGLAGDTDLSQGGFDYWLMSYESFSNENRNRFHPIHLSKIRSRIHSPGEGSSSIQNQNLTDNVEFEKESSSVKNPLFSLNTKASHVSGIMPSAGNLDLSFDSDGKNTTELNSGKNDSAYSTEIQSDGKILVAGDTFNGVNTDFGIVRYNTDGSLDTTFGNGGKVILPIGMGFDFVNAIDTQTDGKIVIAGYSEEGGNDADFTLVRLNMNGTVDTSFGINGKTLTDIAGNEDQIVPMIIEPNGKILAAGWSRTSFQSDVALVRYNSDGTLDTSFDTDGIVVTAIANNRNDFASDIVLQTDGKIVITGEAENGANTDFFVARYETNGTLDAAFGTNGKTITDFANSEDGATSLVLQTDGKIVVGGYTGNLLNPDFALARYNADGTIDTAFGANGKTITDFVGNADFVNDIAIRGNGTIIAVGLPSNRPISAWPVDHFFQAGNWEPTLGQTANKIVVAGASFNGANDDFAVARYLAAAPTAAAASVSGQVLKPDGIGIKNATVKLTASNGLIQIVRTNSFGYFRFEEVMVGETYLLEVRHKNYIFTPQILTVNEDIFDLNVIANESFGGNFNMFDECLICSFEDSGQSSQFFGFGKF